MPNWESYNLQGLFPQEAATIVQSGIGVASSVASLLTTLGQFVEGLSYLIIDFTDPIAAIVQQIQTEINNWLQDVTQTDVWMLFVGPGPRVNQWSQGTDEFIERIANSFWDSSDPSRPIFSDSASYAGIVLMAGSAGIGGFKPQLMALKNIFADDRFRQIAEEITSAIVGTVLTKQVAGSPALQDLPVSSLDGFPQSSKIVVGNERTEYSGMLTTLKKLRRCRVRHSHGIGTSVQIFDVAENKPGTTKLTAAVSQGARQLPVTDASGFPYSGSIRIGSDLINFEARSNVLFKDLVTSQAHQAGEVVELVSDRSAIGEPPDWHELNLGKILGPMRELITGLEFLNSLFEPAGKASSELQTLGQLLQQKGQAMQTLADDLQTLLDNFQQMLSATGFYMLKISGSSGGTSAFVEDLRNAANKPPFDSDGFTAGLVVYAGTAGLGPLEIIFG
jgi:hypothetical protein